MHGRPVNVARLVEDKPAEIMLRNLMSNERLKIVDLSGGVRASLDLLQALRRNEIVAIQGDGVTVPMSRFSPNPPPSHSAPSCSRRSRALRCCPVS